MNAKKVMTAQGVEDFTDSKTDYTVLRADSHDDAIQIFSEHHI